MRRSKKDPKDWSEKSKFLKPETKQGIVMIASFALVFFFILASLNYAGSAGQFFYHSLSRLFGSGFFIIPAILFLLGISFIKNDQSSFIIGRLVAGLVSFLSALSMVSILFPNPTGTINGGMVGQLLARPLTNLFDFYSLILLTALLIIALLVIFDTKLNLKKLLSYLRPTAATADGAVSNFGPPLTATPASNLSPTPTETNLANNEDPVKKILDDKTETKETEKSTWQRLVDWGTGTGTFVPPPLTLLEADSGKPSAGDIKANANIIKRTLANFGIAVEMDEISIGPSITRYALKPAEGIKLSRIVALQNDLALALAAHPIRIEAPIPGKSLVGIEIPNTTKSIVGLASLIGAKEFSESPQPLLVTLGRGISGSAHYANLGKAPHFLIAGATGSGKSVVIHTFITSLLYRNPPQLLRFIMIDPKRVELTLYNGIPHLLTPVVTDAKKTIVALKWAAKEMERRYNILEQYAVRDISSYHRNVVEPAQKIEGDQPDKMPYIVIIIDELADIMSSYPRELEAAVVRLAQMSRAVGIHLVLSTQRPSVEVITGLIKANIPSRIALQVASQIDSRTILDMGGAEKLLGSGDLLFISGDMSKPIRLQSAFICEEEVKKIVKHLKAQAGEASAADVILAVTDTTTDTDEETAGWDDDNDGNDELYEEARETVMKAGKASASYLQRKLKIGYARAARLLDMLEERGVIGPGEGAKIREVYERYPTENTPV